MSPVRGPAATLFYPFASLLVHTARRRLASTGSLFGGAACPDAFGEPHSVGFSVGAAGRSTRSGDLVRRRIPYLPPGFIRRENRTFPDSLAPGRPLN